MLNLLQCNFCIQNQIELANNIAYSNYLFCTVRSYCLQPVRFHTCLGCSVSLLSCSSSIFQWDFWGSLKHRFNFIVWSIQASLLKEDEVLQVWSYRGLGPPTAVAGAGEYVYRRCVLGEGLYHHGKELKKEIIRLCNIRDYKRKRIKSSQRPCSYRSLNLQLHWRR